ncbi:MAG: gas vesicle protein [Clostridia bacterium]|nr:gas vesicle protein [Clostridia bacterium]
MKISAVVTTVNKFFTEELKRPGEVISVSKTENGWKVLIEVIEEDEYMRVRAKDDLLATYEVELDDNLEILGFGRVGLRERDEIPAS